MERWATFDCYGTLIDWNGGIGRELERVFGADRTGGLLNRYHALEPQIQRADPSRSRGYGRALLHHSFREFRRRGLTHASLGVDAANPTGATRLYESVGMYVEVEYIVWEKTLS